MTDRTDSGQRVRVALIKAMPEKWNLQANWATFEWLARQAADQRAQIVCTPECFLDGYVTPEADWTPERFAKICEPLDGPYLSKARELAASLRIHLIFGFTQRDAAGGYNAAALIDDAGRLLGVYHKTHLLNHDSRYLPGRDLPVFETRFGKIGIMICADRRWPETARVLRVKGAQALFVPTYGMHHLANEWWMRTRAYENEVFLCFAHPRVAFVADPKGELPAKLESSDEGVLVHDINLADNTDVMLRARRPELYRILTEPPES